MYIQGSTDFRKDPSLSILSSTVPGSSFHFESDLVPLVCFVGVTIKGLWNLIVHNPSKFWFTLRSVRDHSISWNLIIDMWPVRNRSLKGGLILQVTFPPVLRSSRSLRFGQMYVYIVGRTVSTLLPWRNSFRNFRDHRPFLCWTPRCNLTKKHGLFNRVIDGSPTLQLLRETC